MSSGLQHQRTEVEPYRRALSKKKWTLSDRELLNDRRDLAQYRKSSREVGLNHLNHKSGHLPTYVVVVIARGTEELEARSDLVTMNMW